MRPTTLEEVTPLMNNPRFEAPKCIEPIIN